MKVFQLTGYLGGYDEDIVREDVDFYPLREGLQDAYLDFCMEEALRTGNAVRTETQSWVEKKGRVENIREGK